MIVKGMGRGAVSFTLCCFSELGPQSRAKWRGFRSCHSSRPCLVGFWPSHDSVGIGTWGMACAFSHFRASAPSSLGMAGGSAVWCLPDLASGLEFLLRHLLIGYLGEISSYFSSSVKWGQLYALELLNKILHVNFPKVSKIY